MRVAYEGSQSIELGGKKGGIGFPSIVADSQGAHRIQEMAVEREGAFADRKPISVTEDPLVQDGKGR